MVNGKVFHGRLRLKYDTHENWLKNDPVLLEGEAAFSVVSVKQEGTVNTVPAVLIKVGDGTKKYSELGFTYARAADVIAAAKSEQALKVFVKNVITEAGVATGEALAALSGKVTALEGKVGTETVAKQIEDAIATVNEEYANLQSTLNTKVSNETFNSYKTTNDEKVAANTTAIATEKSRAEGVERDHNQRLETMEAFWREAQRDDTEVNVIDTLKEIQDYIASDQTGASAMAASIKQNTDAIALKANDADLKAVAKSGLINDLEQTENIVIVFDCGSSSKNI